MWALGNVITRRFGSVNLIGLVVWGALIPPLPFFGLSLWLEGPELIKQSLSTLGLKSILCLTYLAFIATMLGYTLWSRLLSKYTAGTVAPYSLLVPVVAMSASSIFLGEHFSNNQWLGGVLVMMGLIINAFGTKCVRWLIPARP
ncbi:putative amino-acid metabolite efflux pump [compost metagenome]